MKLENKNVLVAGTGISGIGATKLLMAVGAEVIVYDSNEAVSYTHLDVYKRQVKRNKCSVITSCGVIFLFLMPMSQGLPLKYLQWRPRWMSRL